MIEPWRTLAIIGASIAAVVVLVLVLVLVLRLPAFLARLIVALGTGLAFGAEPAEVLEAVRKGAGEALGFVAVVIGLGAMLGRCCRHRAGSRRSPTGCSTGSANAAHHGR